MNGLIPIISQCAEIRKWSQMLREENATIAFVPTMGALHDGHIGLIREAEKVTQNIVVSIFVNPTQFSEKHDFTQYPRTIDQDLEKLSQTSTRAVFLPEADEMYPHGYRTSVHPGYGGSILETEQRPQHFSGMLTIVHKFLALIRPDWVFLGEKDYQQYVLVTQMIQDLHITTEPRMVQTLRDQSGLALSSRNQLLSQQDRTVAAHLYQALLQAQRAHTRLDAEHYVQHALSLHPRITTEYVAIRNPDLTEYTPGQPARLLAAITISGVRLLDTILLSPFQE